METPIARSGLTRRSVVLGVAWAAPTIVSAVGAPAYASSTSAAATGDGQFVVSNNCGTSALGANSRLAISFSMNGNYGWTRSYRYCSSPYAPTNTVYCPTGGAYWISDAPRYLADGVTLNSPTCMCVDVWLPACYGTPVYSAGVGAWYWPALTPVAGATQTVGGVLMQRYESCKTANFTQLWSYLGPTGTSCPSPGNVVTDCSGHAYTDGVWAYNVGPNAAGLTFSLQFSTQTIWDNCGVPTGKCPCNDVNSGFTNDVPNIANFTLTRSVCWADGTTTMDTKTINAPCIGVQYTDYSYV